MHGGKREGSGRKRKPGGRAERAEAAELKRQIKQEQQLAEKQKADKIYAAIEFFNLQNGKVFDSSTVLTKEEKDFILRYHYINTGYSLFNHVIWSMDKIGTTVSTSDKVRAYRARKKKNS